MKFFAASVETIVWRLYMLMLAVVVPFMIGVPALAIVALPIFLSGLLGVSFKASKDKNEVSVQNTNQGIVGINSRRLAS